MSDFIPQLGDYHRAEDPSIADDEAIERFTPNAVTPEHIQAVLIQAGPSVTYALWRACGVLTGSEQNDAAGKAAKKIAEMIEDEAVNVFDWKQLNEGAALNQHLRD